MGYTTLADTNQFKFKCPIFNAETKMSSCIKLRDLVWKGKNPDQRKGCQVCMTAGKCPAAHIAQKMAMSGTRDPEPDVYGSNSPIMGKLRKNVLERILPVVIMSSTLARFTLSSVELNMIQTADNRIAAMLGTAPGEAAKATTLKGSSRKTKRVAASSKTETSNKIDKIDKAAASGDLSAAI